jgi:hypothetical protein
MGENGHVPAVVEPSREHPFCAPSINRASGKLLYKAARHRLDQQCVSSSGDDTL